MSDFYKVSLSFLNKDGIAIVEKIFESRWDANIGDKSENLNREPRKKFIDEMTEVLLENIRSELNHDFIKSMIIKRGLKNE